MLSLDCNQRTTCCGLSIVVSFFLGVIAAILRIMGVITVTPAFLWVVFGIAVVYLAIVLAISALNNSECSPKCVCRTLSLLLTGVLGTILTSVILLAITFVTTSVVGAIITGALIAFFSLLLTASACLVKCYAGCRG